MTKSDHIPNVRKMPQDDFNPVNEIDRLTAENKVLKEFAREVIKEMCWDIPTSTLGDLSGGDIQNFAERLGLIIPHILTEQDVKEYPDSDFEVGGTIYVFSEILK